MASLFTSILSKVNSGLPVITTPPRPAPPPPPPPNPATTPVTAASSSTGRPVNYITVNRFYIETDGLIAASFSECSGFGVNIKKETYLEGGVNDQQRVILGHAEFDDLTLKRGMSDDPSFWRWIQSVLTSPKGKRRNVNILMFNQAGETMQSWTLIGAVPIGWKAPGFQAEGNSVAIEELVLAYEGLTVQVGTARQAVTNLSASTQRGSLGFFG